MSRLNPTHSGMPEPDRELPPYDARRAAQRTLQPFIYALDVAEPII